MNTNPRNRRPLVVLIGLMVVALLAVVRLQPAQAQREAGPSAGPRYSVIDTEGHNLIVTDNQSNTVFFYTIDRDKEIGSELILRGSIDLNQVGKPMIKPVTVKAGQ